MVVRGVLGPSCWRSLLHLACCAVPQLADELGYVLSDSRKLGITEWQEHISEVAASTGLSGREVSGGCSSRHDALRPFCAFVAGMDCRCPWLTAHDCRFVQGLFELAARTYAARRSMQGSVDGSEEVALADILAADGKTADGADRGNAKGSANRPKGRSSTSKRSRMSPTPNIREEIDAW